MRYNDPTGHMRVDNEGGGGCSTSGYCPGSSGSSNASTAPVIQSGVDDDPLNDEPDLRCNNDLDCLPDNGISISNTDENRITPPCEYIASYSTCQSISNYIGVGVLTLDTVAGVGTTIFAILMSLAASGTGPFGAGAVEAAYLIANPVEGWMGGASFGLTFINDFLVTGNSYISLADEELVISSDVVISGIFAVAGGLDPEPYGDSLMNDTAAIYDLYRLNGGDELFDLHLSSSGWYLD